MTWTLVTFIWEKAVLPPRAVQGRMKQKHIHSQSFNSASSYVLAVPVNCGGHLNILHGPHENAFGFAKMTSSTWSIVIIHTISSSSCSTVFRVTAALSSGIDHCCEEIRSQGT
ncbi:uncharacterized protein LOC111091708 isoform X5 [Canis lupus familiaris]|uniref:uncharacterized protein LOC111091708 isoform X5 n=1 Tax=Canis lupus familiaris TaxID=9615 RepID=UPI0015F148A7|nr:uncharacterized protein LOC111091708 isoform X5 [Canis lupus familiaris]XP_038312499.1 uncharacterized protein LOC111091708 isoform X5 [Canis lupus familiaris]XP_038425954.1 uncharacterized protein LOC111091708 isoform X5 [Canis lupus familiaris]XP_048955375.1 uncharacterized protein LOC112656094 isoform X6 [Canis lupus dingo]